MQSCSLPVAVFMIISVLVLTNRISSTPCNDYGKALSYSSSKENGAVEKMSMCVSGARHSIVDIPAYFFLDPDHPLRLIGELIDIDWYG